MSRTIRASSLVVVAALGASALACRSDMSRGTSAPAERPASAPEERPADAPAERPASEPAARPTKQPARREPASADPEAGRLAGITAAHNRVREPLGLPPLTWSDELARFAQKWADKLQRQGCDLRHRPRSGPDAQRYGENIFSMTGHAPTAAEVVDTWAAEVKDYDAKKNTCKGVCGHYTQIVWRKSQRLGCAMAACGDTEVWVCNYDPPGNYLGQRPY